MTAVEWLEKQLNSNSIITQTLLKKALEMERQQIENAYTYGQKNVIDIASKELKFSFVKTNEELKKVIENKENNEDAEQYYNETFKK